MKAIIHSKYGPPDELSIQEVDKPVPKKNEVLIKIHATTVTSTDCNARNFTFVPKLFKLPAQLFMFGLFKPRIPILGVDLAGEIEAIGESVTQFKVGDQVFGSPEMALGAHAQYTCLPETAALVKKPPTISWEEAAAIPLAGVTAYHFVIALVTIQAGQKILINGASGGIGTFAVQLAKSRGAHVTGVCSSANVDLVKSLGADAVIDYTQEDFTKSKEPYDIVLDVVGKTTFSRCNKILKKKSTYLACLMELPDLLQIARSSLFGGKKVKGGVAISNKENLTYLRDLVENKTLKVVIDKIYPFEHIVDAYEYVESGHKKGNVVVKVPHSN